MTSSPLSAEDKLKRYLYISSERNIYICGNLELHQCYKQKNLTAVSELITAKKLDNLLQIIESANHQDVLSTRKTLFFALACAVNSETEQESKHKIYEVLQKIAKSAEDLFEFLKFYTLHNKKVSCALSKVISRYYLRKDPYNLAIEVTNQKSHHSWSHKDVFKLVHIKTDQIASLIIINYVLFNLTKASETAEGKGEVADKIMTRFKKIDELKRSESIERIIELANELRCNSITRIPSYYHKTMGVWDVLVPNMPINDIIDWLPKFYRMEFFKSQPFIQKVATALTNADSITSSKIHPMEVYLGLKNFNKGGKPKDPKLVAYLATSLKAAALSEDKKDETTPVPPDRLITCAAIEKALNKALLASYKNCKTIGKSILIVIDVTEKMDKPCFYSKNITCLEAAAMYTLALLQTESNVTVSVFNGNKISLVHLDKNVPHYQALTKLRQVQSAVAKPSAPFDWATSKKKPIQLFFNFTYSYNITVKSLVENGGNRNRFVDAFKKYKQKLAVTNSKLVLFSMGSPNNAMVTDDLDVLTVCGFSKEVPKIVEAFSKDLFN